MLKKISYIIFLILVLILISIFYLSNFGLKTDRFNENISDQLKKNYPKINVNFTDINVLLKCSIVIQFMKCWKRWQSEGSMDDGKLHLRACEQISTKACKL